MAGKRCLSQQCVLRVVTLADPASENAAGLTVIHSAGFVIWSVLFPEHHQNGSCGWYVGFACCRDNLIFDTGTIKLADFGLSKSLPVNKHAGYDLDSKFKLTGETGSYRYMAPEVFRHEPYNFKVTCIPLTLLDVCPFKTYI